MAPLLHRVAIKSTILVDELLIFGSIYQKLSSVAVRLILVRLLHRAVGIFNKLFSFFHCISYMIFVCLHLFIFFLHIAS